MGICNFSVAWLQRYLTRDHPSLQSDSCLAIFARRERGACPLGRQSLVWTHLRRRTLGRCAGPQQKTLRKTITAIAIAGSLHLQAQATHALTMQEAVDQAVRTHPTVRNQTALYEAALADVQTARQQYLPTPSISVEQVSDSGTGYPKYGSRTMVQTYRLQQPLWAWGRLDAGVDKARSISSVAAEGAHDALQQIALRTVQAWSEWHLSLLRIRAQQRSLETHERLTNVLQRRVSEGASAASEFSLTRMRLQQARSQLQAYSAQHKVARWRLSQMVGREITEHDLPSEDEREQEIDVRDIQARALAASAALKKIAGQKEVLNHEARERRADWLPEFFLRLERQHYSGEIGASIGANNRIYLGLSSRFGAGLSSFTVLEGIAKRRHALDAEYEATERNLIETVESEREQLIALEARLPNLRDAMVAAKETAEAWDRQFLAGRRSWVELMNAVREVVQAEIEWADARVGRIAAHWRLSIYAGNLTQVWKPLPDGAQ